MDNRNENNKINQVTSKINRLRLMGLHISTFDEGKTKSTYREPSHF